MSRRCIVTYAEGAHEELLDVALPTYRVFAKVHGYDLIEYRDTAYQLPPAWKKIPLLQLALQKYDVAVWFDCDMIVVDPSQDLPPICTDESRVKYHALVRHFDGNSEVPNSGVWQVTEECNELLDKMMDLEVFRNHGWWEQAALMTMMGYSVPPEGTHFPDTKCHNKYQTRWYKTCNFMRLKYNSHPNYRADKPVIVHCSYPQMQQRLEVMRALVKDPTYDYPRFDKVEEEETKS